MEEKKKKRLKTAVEDIALLATLPINDNDRETDEILEDRSETDKLSEEVLNEEKVPDNINSTKYKSSIRTLVNDDTYLENEYEEFDLYDSFSNDEDYMLDDYIFENEDYEDMAEDVIDNKSPYLKSNLYMIGRTAVQLGRTTRTLNRLQEGKYTNGTKLVNSMGKTAIKPVQRKVRNKIIKQTKKVVFANPISKMITRIIKKFIKIIIQQITALLSALLGLSFPLILVLTLLLSLFGMGGYDHSVIDSYEKYMIEINEKNKERVDDYKSDNIFAEIYSSQGNEYGSVNWRAVISCIQILYGDDLSFSSKERIFLKQLELSNMYERYEEKEEVKITVNEDDEEVKVKIMVMTIVNPGIDEYIDFLKQNYNISDLDEKAIRTLYVSPNLMDAFSPEISGKYGGGKVFDDEKIQILFQEAEKYLGRPYVWGGSSPSTGFDCSGFVCYVYTKTKTYNLPRTTAQGIYNQCVPITEDEARPGDLIFFKGTYESSNTVTHIGIYAGDGLMLHCGDPIQYASYKTTYWQNHFFNFGRLK